MTLSLKHVFSWALITVGVLCLGLFLRFQLMAEEQAYSGVIAFILLISSAQIALGVSMLRKQMSRSEYILVAIMSLPLLWFTFVFSLGFIGLIAPS